MNTLDEVKLPTQEDLPFSQTTPECINGHQSFDRWVAIPGNSSPLQLAVLLNRLQVADLILEQLESTMRQYQTVLSHVNNQLYNDLMYLVQLGSDEAYQVLERHGRLLIKREFRYRNVIGTTATSIALREGHSRFARYFLGLCNDPAYLQTVQRHLKAQMKTDMLQLTRQQRTRSNKHYQTYKLFKHFSAKQYPSAPEWMGLQKRQQLEQSDESTNTFLHIQPMEVERSVSSSQLQSASMPIVDQIVQRMSQSRRKTQAEKAKDTLRGSDSEISVQNTVSNAQCIFTDAPSGGIFGKGSISELSRVRSDQESRSGLCFERRSDTQ